MQAAVQLTTNEAGSQASRVFFLLIFVANIEHCISLHHTFRLSIYIPMQADPSTCNRPTAATNFIVREHPIVLTNKGHLNGLFHPNNINLKKKIRLKNISLDVSPCQKYLITINVLALSRKKMAVILMCAEEYFIHFLTVIISVLTVLQFNIHLHKNNIVFPILFILHTCNIKLIGKTRLLLLTRTANDLWYIFSSNIISNYCVYVVQTSSLKAKDPCSDVFYRKIYLQLIEVNKSSLVFPFSSHKKGRCTPCEMTSETGALYSEKYSTIASLGAVSMMVSQPGVHLRPTVVAQHMSALAAAGASAHTDDDSDEDRGADDDDYIIGGPGSNSVRRDEDIMNTKILLMNFQEKNSASNDQTEDAQTWNGQHFAPQVPDLDMDSLPVELQPPPPPTQSSTNCPGFWKCIVRLHKRFGHRIARQQIDRGLKLYR
ncbi:hypothetical protein GQR58_025394 [Nymphon striatum]|nr:hypothetical protein GQR58_025394 [Nymphon striatum]